MHRINMTVPIQPILAIAWFVTLLVSQAQPTPTPLSGGGEVSLRQDGSSLHVAIKGPRAGLASLCVGDDARVRILHASAAVGEATYEKAGDHWKLTSGFEWKLRDSPRTGAPSQADVSQFLADKGWVANASSAGAPSRAFTIRLSDRIRFVGITFLAIDEPMSVSHWPAAMADDCRALKVAQGYLPDTARFNPSAWHHVK